MTDLSAAIGELLAAGPTIASSPGAAKCRWCGQAWTAAHTEPCQHFSPGAGHCPDCDRQWTGSREAHCAACHRHFSSDSAFDLHQRLDHDPCDLDGEHGRACLAVLVCSDPKRLAKVQTPDGPLWAWPGSRPPESIPERSAP